MIRLTALVSVAAVIGVMLGTSSTLAADLSTPSYSKNLSAYQAPTPSWSGCYLGANIGAGWDSTHTDGIAFAGVPFVPPVDYGSSSGTGFIGGGQVGCDYQFASSWIIGIQGKADFGSISSKNPVVVVPGITASYQLKNTEDLTARIGYAFSPAILGYVKGGVAWANANASSVAPGAITGETASFTRTGYTVGGGLEWKFGHGWSLFGEYSYLDFGTKSSNLYSTGLADPSLGFGATGALSDTVSLRLRSQQALIGVNYRFDWAGPVVAKY
jgi:outer membrane immunogenic protein